MLFAKGVATVAVVLVSSILCFLPLVPSNAARKPWLSGLRRSSLSDGHELAFVASTWNRQRQVRSKKTLSSRWMVSVSSPPSSSAYFTEHADDDDDDDDDDEEEDSLHGHEEMEYDVVFEKVVRPQVSAAFSSSSSRKSGVTVVKKQEEEEDIAGFVPRLMEFLQSSLLNVLPEDLPMMYQVHVPDEDDRTANVLYVESPLATPPESSRLAVEVVALYPQVDKELEEDLDPSLTQVASMAMIVVKKLKPQPQGKHSNQPLMMQGLFQESEKAILARLDGQLDDFVEGRIALPTETNKKKKEEEKKEKTTAARVSPPEPMQKSQRDKKKEEEEEEEELDEAPYTSRFFGLETKKTSPPPMNVTRDEGGNVVIDTVAVDSVPTTAAADEAVMTKEEEEKKKSSQQGYTVIVQPPPPAEEDFAVRAAKAAAVATKRTISKPPSAAVAGEDFAVMAARQRATAAATPATTAAAIPKRKKGTAKEAAAASPKRTKKQTKTGTGKQKSSSRSTKRAVATAARETSQRTRSGKKPFMISISKPADRARRIQAAAKQNQTLTEKDTTISPDAAQTPKEPVPLRGVDLGLNGLPRSQQRRSDDKTTVLRPPQKPQEPRRDDSEMDLQEAQEQLEAALKEMPGTDQGDWTAEELLQDILKFGQEEKKKDTTGTGFVDGAFETAKTLLRRQTEKKQAAKQVEFREPSSSNLRPDIADPDESSATTTANDEWNAEEELKRLFAAGEEMAQNRSLSVPTANDDDSGAAAPSIQSMEQEVQELINADESVSRYSRRLEDGLSEFKVQIAKSPDEDLDGPRRNPVFDVLNGPQTYNPNVDPKTAVNWPGAPEGTRTDVRLPTELAMAVKSAQYAVDVLTRMTVVGDDKEEEEDDDDDTRYYLDKKELSRKQVRDLRTCVHEAVAVGLIDDPVVRMEEKARLSILLDELAGQAQDRFEEIVSHYRDLFLSDNFVSLLRERLAEMAEEEWEALRQVPDDAESTPERDDLLRRNEEQRDNMGRLSAHAQLLLKQARALGAQLESAHLEVIRSICQVAMDPQYTTEQETAEALTDAVRDMRPMFDDSFLAYLKYAVAEEEARLARAGVLDDADHNQWYFCLRIIREGVHREVARSMNRYIEHIWYILRMKTASERKMLLEELVEVMPTLDVRPFVAVVNNMVGALGDAVRGEFASHDTATLSEWTIPLLQLRQFVEQVLPPERIKEKSREADEWAASRRKRLLEQRQATLERLKGSGGGGGKEKKKKEEEEEEEDWEPSGEVERFD